jgi:hypothetical protein
MVKRKAIKQSIRFEVFKRDSFTCQYCGRKAPDVILEIDHIIPVSKGGNNSIENLVSACRECNGGKSDKKLSELSEVEKSRVQIEELQEKKNMTDMIIKWKQGLNDTLKYQTSEIESVFFGECNTAGFSMSDPYRKSLKSNIRKFGFDIMLDSVYIAVENYVKTGSPEEIDFALKKLPGIAFNKFTELHNPDKASMRRVMNIACNNLNISPKQFYSCFPSTLYNTEHEETVVHLISASDDEYDFWLSINEMYSGGNNA